jgi:hypothetical protein
VSNQINQQAGLQGLTSTQINQQTALQQQQTQQLYQQAISQGLTTTQLSQVAQTMGLTTEQFQQQAQQQGLTANQYAIQQLAQQTQANAQNLQTGQLSTSANIINQILSGGGQQYNVAAEQAMAPFQQYSTQAGINQQLLSLLTGAGTTPTQQPQTTVTPGTTGLLAPLLAAAAAPFTGGTSLIGAGLSLLGGGNTSGGSFDPSNPYDLLTNLGNQDFSGYVGQGA